MKIVIDISEMTLLNITSRELLLCSREDIEKLEFAIKNGTVLPKGHGDLKDFQKMYDDMTEKEELAMQRVIDTPTNSPCYMRYVAQLNERTAFKEMLFDAPTIIKADKESEDKE